LISKGPKDEKRPANVIGNVVNILKIATGEIEDTPDLYPGKNSTAAELGRLGALRAPRASLCKKKRTEIAKKAAVTR